MRPRLVPAAYATAVLALLVAQRREADQIRDLAAAILARFPDGHAKYVAGTVAPYSNFAAACLAFCLCMAISAAIVRACWPPVQTDRKDKPFAPLILAYVGTAVLGCVAATTIGDMLPRQSYVGGTQDLATGLAYAFCVILNGLSAYVLAERLLRAMGRPWLSLLFTGLGIVATWEMLAYFPMTNLMPAYAADPATLPGMVADLPFGWVGVGAGLGTWATCAMSTAVSVAVLAACATYRSWTPRPVTTVEAIPA